MTRYILPPLMCALLLCGCMRAGMKPDTASDAEFTAAVFAMDTEMTLKAYGAHAEEALAAAEAEIKRLDNALRRGSSDSEIYKVNSQGSAQVSADTAALTERALEICGSTEGAFDISIAPIMDLWGFYTKDFHVPTGAELAETLGRVDYRSVSVDGTTVSVTDGAQLDLGGIAKGCLSSRIMEIMSEHGVESGIVSLGGNVQALGKKPNGSDWRVAIQDPDDPDAFAGAVTVSDEAVITSGGYQRYFERDGEVYHHIIDPQTGMPANSGVKSVSIVSSDGTLADGLSTALFVMGLDKGSKYWRTHDGFEVIFITDENDIYITKGLEGKFQSSAPYTILK